jgi:hypothetical protein
MSGLYNFILEIVWNDNTIKYTFQVNSSDAHWILYIDVWNNRYSFDSITSWLEFDKFSLWENKAKKKHKPDFYDNQDDYFEWFIDKMDKKDIIVYDNWWKKLKIVRKWLFIFFIYKNKPIKYININWFKRLSKNISKIKSIKYIWFVPNISKVDEISDFLLSRVMDRDKEDVRLILSQINKNRLLEFFN